MSHTESLPPPSSSVVALSPQRMLSLLLLLLVLPSSSLVMTSSPLAVGLWRRGNRVSATNVCRRSKASDGGLMVRCSGRSLTQVPAALSNRTTRLFLDQNLLRSLPADSFLGLFRLHELDLSSNQLSLLDAGCFRGVTSSLRLLDLSSNRLSVLDPAVLGGLWVRANLTHNPWHCDCSMQLSMPQLNLDESSLAEVVCRTSDLPNLGAVGTPLVVLLDDWDLCESVRRTTDFLTLITMLLWFVMVISYLVYYIRHNKVVARRRFDYLKFLESRDPFRDRTT